MARVSIRELRSEDRQGWLELWSGYLAFYRVELDERVTRTTFERLCDGAEGMFGLVAVDGGGGDERVVGFANAIVHPSTWALAGYCYLEDLFVARGARGGNVGEELIEATALAAHERGVERLYWHTQQFNGAARSLYDKVGRLTSMVVYERDV
jgi:GNAT superfamily N-acetyltransferase